VIPKSGLYTGRVVHSRVRPRAHRLSYRCYWILLDLDEISALSKKLRLFSYNRFNAFSIRDVDHGTGQRQSLKAQVKRHLFEAGIDLSNGKVLLLAMPRVLGYAFNPISIYYCYRPEGRLVALVYEVHNTFKQRHSYLIAVDPDSSQNNISQRCEKRLYVSPFLKMDLRYEFDVIEPFANVRLTVRASDPNRLLLSATLAGDRSDLTDANLLKVFFGHPLLTVKVIAAIHWEAARLWWKGMRVYVRPNPPASPVTAFTAKCGDRNDE
jgi:DUF1365 family protein